MVLLKFEKKMMENVRAGDHFNNDENGHPPTLLKTESTTDTLIGQVDKFQNSRFKEHL